MNRAGDTWPPGDACQHGGGSAWLTGSYDPELDTVYWGTGNPGSWDPTNRAGDNLYTSSVLALDPKTGAIKWHYQFSPNDGFDFDGTNEMVLATIPVEGQPRKVILHANRNGFFYVIDRTNGKLIAANAFVPQNWAKGIDLKTGRPIPTELVARYHKGENVGAVLGAFGGKNWSPMSFNPDTGLAYVNTNYVPIGMKISAQPWKAGELWFGVEMGPPVEADLPTAEHPKAALKAIDPMTGKAKWMTPAERPRWGATLSTKARASCSPANFPASSRRSMPTPVRCCGPIRRARASRASRSPGRRTAFNTWLLPAATAALYALRQR